MAIEYYVQGTSIDSFIIFMIIIPIILLLVFYYIDPFGIKVHYKNAFSIINLILVFSLYSLYVLKKKLYPDAAVAKGEVLPQEFVKKLVLSLGTFIGIFCLGVFLIKKISTITNLFTFLIYIGQALLLFGALAAVFTMFKYFQNPDNQNLFIKIIFYIPCLFIQFADYIKVQFNLTTKPIWIILAIEALLVLLMYIIPKIYQYMIDKNSLILIRNPVYLNNKYSLGTFEELNKDNDKMEIPDRITENPSKTVGNCTVPGVPTSVSRSTNNDRDSRKYSYAISAWYYINPQPPNTSAAYNVWTPIINYENNPIFEYHGLTNSLRVQTNVPSHNVGDTTIKNKLKEVYVTNDIDYQKWNNIVFNYDGANIDIFSNGYLVATQSNISPYMKFDSIIGGSDNGIHGGLCNVKYYPHSLKKSEIMNTYNLLKTLNPPLL